MLSVSKVVKAGNRVVFEDSGSYTYTYIEHKESGEVTPLVEKGGLYKLNVGPQRTVAPFLKACSPTLGAVRPEGDISVVTQDEMGNERREELKTRKPPREVVLAPPPPALSFYRLFRSWVAGN